MSKKVLFCAIASAIVVSLAVWSLAHNYSAPKTLVEENINALTDGEFDPDTPAEKEAWIVNATDTYMICTLGGDMACK